MTKGVKGQPKRMPELRHTNLKKRLVSYVRGVKKCGASAHAQKMVYAAFLSEYHVEPEVAAQVARKLSVVRDVAPDHAHEVAWVMLSSEGAHAINQQLNGDLGDAMARVTLVGSGVSSLEDENMGNYDAHQRLVRAMLPEEVEA